MISANPDSTLGASPHTNAQIRVAMNVAQREIAAATCAVQRETTYTLTASVCYKLPYRFIAPRALYLIRPNANGYDRVTYRDAQEFPSVKKPGAELAGETAGTNTDQSRVDFVTEFSVFGDSLKINPMLGEVTGHDLRLDYCAYPTPLTSDSQTCDLPEYCDFAVVKLAEWILNSANLTITEETAALTNLSSMAGYFVERYARKVEAGK